MIENKISPDTLCFSLSGMSENEKQRLEGLQRLLNLPDLWKAGAIEVAIVHVLEQKVERPYEGWFGSLTQEQKIKLFDYIDQNKEKIISIYELNI